MRVSSPLCVAVPHETRVVSTRNRIATTRTRTLSRAPDCGCSEYLPRRSEGAVARTSTGVHGDPGGVRERALKRLRDLPAVDVVPESRHDVAGAQLRRSRRCALHRVPERMRRE